MLSMAAATMLSIADANAKSIDYKGKVDVRRGSKPSRGVTGRVCNDRNRDSICQSRERGLRGVLVSDGLNVTITDWRGRYVLPLPTAADEARGVSYFVTEPRGYDVPVDEDNVPQFYYVHKPEGSPLNLQGEPFRFGGLAPTGPSSNRDQLPYGARSSMPRDVLVVSTVTNSRWWSAATPSLTVTPRSATFAIRLLVNSAT